MTVRKSLLPSEKLLAVQKRRTVVMQTLLGALETVTDRRVLDPILALIHDHALVPLPQPDGSFTLICGGLYCLGRSWPCKPLHDLAARLYVRL